jgi:5-methyltetrahydrofolate--homocysteine methyltransferase
MEQIATGETTAAPEADTSADEEKLTGSEAKIALILEEEKHKAQTSAAVRSGIRTDGEIPRPPFWGSKVVDSVPLDDVFEFVNEIALIRGQWRVVRGKLGENEYQKILQERIYPEFIRLKKEAKDLELLTPKVVYGYFPCQSDGNDLLIYDLPEEQTSNLLRASDLKERLRFSFPRQRDDRHLCISDFFCPVESGRIDVVAFHLVTMGHRASEYSRTLFQADNYKEYLYFHGLSVESAEALAELWHRRIRTELGIHANDAKEIRKLFSQHYQGSRYSFGYPACPNLEDQVKLFELLKPERIGVSLSEEYQLDPEQSTSAIIVHHPQARYFFVK